MRVEMDTHSKYELVVVTAPTNRHKQRNSCERHHRLLAGLIVHISRVAEEDG